MKAVILVVGHKREKTGTAHALQLCQSHLTNNQRFLLSYADDLHHRESIEKCLAYDRSVLVARVDNPKKFGVVTTDETGRIMAIEEKMAEKALLLLKSNGGGVQYLELRNASNSKLGYNDSATARSRCLTNYA